MARLLCIDQNEISEALTTNSTVTRGTKQLNGFNVLICQQNHSLKFYFLLFIFVIGETITRHNNVEQALDCRDATAKVHL